MPTPGPLELVIILVIALLILGPGKLPDVGAALGKSIKEFRKASSDVQEAVSVNVDTSPLPAAPVAPAPLASAPVTPRPGHAGSGRGARDDLRRFVHRRQLVGRPQVHHGRRRRPA